MPDGACTFVMLRADGGGGLPVLLAPLTKPEQPLSSTGASATTKNSAARCNTLLILRRNSPEHPRFTVASSNPNKTTPGRATMSPYFPAPALGLFGEKKKEMNSAGSNPKVL